MRALFEKFLAYYTSVFRSGKSQIRKFSSTNLKVSPAAYTCEVRRNLAEYSMTAFAQSETGEMAVKDRFIDSFQNHSDNFLQELVTERRDTQVRLTIRKDPDLMQKREEVVRHPFGTIKWYDGAYYFLCRGKEKVSAEIALSYLTYNLRRAMNIMGAGVLVARIRERNQKTRPERPVFLRF